MRSFVRNGLPEKSVATHPLLADDERPFKTNSTVLETVALIPVCIKSIVFSTSGNQPRLNDGEGAFEDFLPLGQSVCANSRHNRLGIVWTSVVAWQMHL